MTAIRILLIEDETNYAQRIRENLAEAGFDADLATDGTKGWLMSNTESYDAAILDIGLPHVSGLNVLRRWRSEGRKLPVLIVSGRSGWAERVNGLNAGADDYLEKPFQVEELVARLRSLLRRSSGQSETMRRRRDIEIDAAAGTVTKNGVPVELTALELRILDFLMRHSDRIVSQKELLEQVYSPNHGRDSNVAEVYVARLRKKLGRGTIRTIRGMGYRIG
ncbi:MAG: response regulator transcription factor [Bryobacteraceae bacterium]|nr:response regulator transcription factor [Bryobacteraceae bacterium]